MSLFLDSSLDFVYASVPVSRLEAVQGSSSLRNKPIGHVSTRARMQTASYYPRAMELHSQVRAMADGSDCRLTAPSPFSEPYNRTSGGFENDFYAISRY